MNQNLHNMCIGNSGSYSKVTIILLLTMHRNNQEISNGKIQVTTKFSIGKIQNLSIPEILQNSGIPVVNIIGVITINIETISVII